jgi:hypothetical protein
VKSETRELNRKTGELIRNANVNKMSYLAPSGTCTGAQAGRCAIGECALADAAPLLAVPPDIRRCGRACSCHMHCRAYGHVRAQAAQLRRTPKGRRAVWQAPVGGAPLPRYPGGLGPRAEKRAVPGGSTQRPAPHTHARGRVHGQQRTENRSSDTRMAIYSCFMGRIRKIFHSNIMHRIHGMHLHTEHEWYRHEGCMACLMLSCDAYYSDSGRVAPPSSFITRLTRQRRLDSDSSNTHLSRRRGRIVGFPSVQDKLST